jgi:hypothetical protein
MTMFLTVTPHLEPTHTFWGDDGHKLPPLYAVATRAERLAAAPSTEPLPDLARRFLHAVQSLAAAAAAHAAAQQENITRLDATLAGGDARCKAAVDEIWHRLAPIYAPLREMETLWNDLAARVSDHCAASS